MNPTKEFLLVEPKVKAVAPNIALMKFARWCELKGHESQYVWGIAHPKASPYVLCFLIGKRAEVTKC